MDAALDAHPLMHLKLLLLDDLTGFHDLSHLVNGDHGYGARSDACQAKDDLLDML